MTEKTIRTRAEIPERYTWNAPSLFASPEAWEAEAKQVQQDLPRIETYRGKLSEDPQTLLAMLGEQERLLRRVGKLLVYAQLSRSVNAGDPAAARMFGQVMGLFGQVGATFSFIEPEILSIGKPTLDRWIQEEPKLKVFGHYFEDLYRKQEHVRSAEIEEILGMLSPTFESVRQTATTMTDADFHFAPAVTGKEQEIPITQGNYQDVLSSPDREARRTAYEHYTDTYLGFKNTLASNLSASIQANVFLSRVRRYPDTLSASLFENDIPVEVFHNLVNTFKANLPTWHRYWAIRRKALGVDTLHPYDVWAPLTEKREPIPFEQAIDWISAGLAPMGEDYVRVLRKGALEDRWIDVYPNQGKSSAQFSHGWPGTFPFIFINYNDSIFSLSTLAHELGHSMHSYLTWQNQPFVYGNYSLFAAEVASNFHQAMVRGHLLKTVTDRDLRISIIEEAMSNFHRYFFIMPTLARFELEIHQRAERGQGLPADDLNNLMADLFAEGFGKEMEFDRQRVGITWATFGHLYADYYVYQYTTGISGANALARPILAGQPGAVDRYLNFLKTGSSVYPLKALQAAGVDLSTPQPIEETFRVMSEMVDELERLVTRPA